MSIIVGTDSYVTVVEADDYVSLHYLSTNVQRQAWESLITEDKEILLRKATESINQLCAIGGKYDANQVLLFPRHFELEVSERVKHAQIEEAIEILANNGETITQRTKLQHEGVTSFSLEGLSESYKNGNHQLLSPIAIKLLKRYMSGGYAIK